MLKTIGKVARPTIEALRNSCIDLIPKMQLSNSNYAKGRRQIWLFHEALLTKKTIVPAYFDDRLWDFCQRVYPGSSIALLTFGGTHGQYSSIGNINYHRDDTYAESIARTVNLGTAIFGYNNDRRNSNSGRQTCTTHELNNGQIIEFYCKHQHAVLRHGNERLSLNIWKVKNDLIKYPGLALSPKIAALLKSTNF